MVDGVLGRRRELGRDIEFAHRLAEEALHESDPALPAFPQLRGAGEGAGVEVEVLFDVLVGQQRSGVGDDDEAQPGLDRLEVGLGPHLGHAGDERGLADDEVAQVRSLGGEHPEPGIEVEFGAEVAQFGDRDLVVGLLRVPAGDPVPMVAGQGGFERHHLGGHLVVGDPALLTEARQGGHLLHVREELRAHLGVVVVEVVVLVGQGDAGLVEVEGVDVGVFRISGDIAAEHPADAFDLEAGEQCGEFGLVLGGVDRSERGVQGVHAEFVDPVDVHEGGEEVGDLLAFAAGFLRGVGHGGDDVADLGLRGVEELPHGPVTGAVVGDGEGVDPLAVDVPVQVVLRAGGRRFGARRCVRSFRSHGATVS